MGFLWFGKTINTWKDIGDEKDLKEQREKLNVEWKLLLARKEKAQSQFGEYLKEAEKDSTSDSAKERAAYELSRIRKSIRRYDEELNLTQVNLGTLDAVLDLKNGSECSIGPTLSLSLGQVDPEELKEALAAIKAAKNSMS